MASIEAKAKWLRASRSPPSFIPSSSKSESQGQSLNDLPPDMEWWSYQQPKANKAGSFWNFQRETFTQEDAKMQELKAVINDTSRKKPMLEEALSEDESNKLFSEVESEWFGIKKNEPWWRKADLNDLVLLKSLQHLDNCDLPLPQTNKTEWLVSDKGLASLHQDPKKEKSSFTDSIRPFSTSESKNVETQTPISQLSKDELLEALCRSQRRAREAERAAQEACNEKEHVITHFLKQASHIFAYKQWLYILQLETLCVQLRRRKYHTIYNRFPDLIPWVPTKSKPSVPKRAHKMDKYVGELLLGLALVGAGVLLGWTLGWLFHTL